MSYEYIVHVCMDTTIGSCVEFDISMPSKITHKPSVIKQILDDWDGMVEIATGEVINIRNFVHADIYEKGEPGIPASASKIKR